MNIHSNPIGKDISFVLNNKEAKTFSISNIKLEVHAKHHRYETDAILSVDIVEDYANALGSKVYVKCVMPTGDFIEFMTVDRSLLEATLILTHSENKLDEINYYRAILNPEMNNEIQTDDLTNVNRDALNLADSKVITIELVPVNTESLVEVRTGGIFSSTKVDDLLYSILSTEISRVKIHGNVPIDNIVMSKSTNIKTYDHIVIPDNIRVLALPDYLQEKYGLYNAGVGTYIRRYYKDKKVYNDLHIYPLYNPSKIDIDNDKLALIASPDRSVGLIDKNCLVKDNVVYGVGELNLNDTHKNITTTDLKPLGFHSINESTFQDAVQVKETGPSIDPSTHTNSILFKNRESDIDIINSNDAMNIQQGMSEVARNTGELVNIVLHNSPYMNFRPAMASTLLYLRENKPASVDGVLLKHHTFITKVSKGFVNKVYRTVSNITLFTKSEVYKENR